MALIYCVEDEQNIAELISCALVSGGHTVTTLGSANEFFRLILSQKPELVLLDIMLPDINGMDILKTIKNDENYKDIPIIMLTAKSSELDKVQGLESGADDFITKPFGIMELLSRVKAVLRRSVKTITDDKIQYKQLVLNTSTREVTINNNLVLLTFKEYELLKYLLLNIGIALSRENIIAKVWGYDYEGESRTIDMHIKTLRQKLTDSSCDVNIITIRGVGYKLEKL